MKQEKISKRKKLFEITGEKIGQIEGFFPFTLISF